MIRAVLTIARRDVTATIFSRGFLIWLAMPIIGLAFGVFASLMTAHEPAPPERVAVIDGGGDLAVWVQRTAARERTRAAYARQRQLLVSAHGAGRLPAEFARPAALLSDGELDALAASDALAEDRDNDPTFTRIAAGPDVAVQAARLLAPGAHGDHGRFGAVLVAEGDTMRLLTRGDVDADRVRAVADRAWLRRAMDRQGIGQATDRLRARQPEIPVVTIAEPASVAAKGGPDPIATGAAMVLFALISLLAGALLSNMVEEKSNKIIEVLAASVPVRAIFAGKLLAMLAVSLIGVAVWALLFTGGAMLAAAQMPGGFMPTPARGWPELAALVFAYFVCAYLIYGAIYLGIGSLCSSIREVQTLSMPVTILQMVVLIVTLGALGEPEGAWTEAVSWFPLSAPYMMAGRAAETTGLVLHGAAIAWQLLFAALVIAVSARLFRYGVLRSGPPPSLKQMAGMGLLKRRTA